MDTTKSSAAKVASVSGQNFETIAVDALTPHNRNSRTHSRKQLKQIEESIRRFGFTNPVLVDADNGIIAGHGRVEAARNMNMATVPILRLDHMSEAEKRAYIIADNRLAELAGWDNELLAQELNETLNLDADFELAVTGFDLPDIEALLNGLASEETVDVVVEINERSPVITRLDDLWVLGTHKIICGDATDAQVYQRLMGEEKAQMVFTDPPYNVPVDGHVCGLGKVRHEEFVMASGEMSEEQFTFFLTDVTANLARYSNNGSIHYVCMDWRHMGELLTAGRESYAELKNLVVWNKNNGGMGTFYRSKHELVFVFKNGSAPHINNFGLGQHGRYRTNVWDYAGVNSLKSERAEELAMHPTVKPVTMVADAVRDCSRRNGIVLDAFAGSGTTLIAAEQTKRRARAIELDPIYVDVAIRRWQQVSGEKATLASSGRNFDTLAKIADELSLKTEA